VTPARGPDPAAAEPLRAITPADATVSAFDTLGLAYEHAFDDAPAVADVLDRLAVLAPGSRVLDVGSGTGRPVAERLVAAGHDVVGIDVSPVMVDIARRQVPGARFEVADVRTWASPAGSFDAIAAVFSLLTMPRPELDATLARLAAWLVPGGRLVLATVPADVEGLEIEFLGRPIRATTYPVDVLLERLRDAGLEVGDHGVSTFRPDFPDASPEEHLVVDAHRPW
jgi:SAM-dependent methyltransferase